MADVKSAGKSRLGRGLSSLIKVSIPAQEDAAPVEPRVDAPAKPGRTPPAARAVVAPAVAVPAPVIQQVLKGVPMEIAVGEIRINP